MSSRVQLTLRVLAAVLVVAGTVAFFVMRGQTQRLETSEVAGRAATTSARSAVPKMMTYTAETLTREVETDRALMTDAYAPRYAAMVRTRVLPTATKYGVANTLSVVSTAVVSSTPTRVVVLVFANQTTRSKSQPQGITQGTRLQVTMQREGPKWLVSDVKPL